MTRVALIAALSFGLAAPAMAQHSDHETPPTPAAKQPLGAAPQQPATLPSDHQAHDATSVAEAADPGTGRVMETVDPPEAGNDIPPVAPTDFAADAYYSRGDMDRARRVLDDEHGGTLQSKVMANLLEYQSVNGEGGYRWEGEGWFGGDIDRP
jgi:copper resistance protein B